MDSRILKLVTASALTVGAFAVGSSVPAHAAKPEPLTVAVLAAAGQAVGSAQYSFEINAAARQVSAVSVTLNGVQQTAPPIVAVTSKSSGGSGAFTALAPGDYSVVVTITPKRGTPLIGSAGFTIAPTTTPTDAEKLALASAWCSANSGTFETGKDYRLGSNFEATIDYWVYGAFWACMHADSVWTLLEPNGVDAQLSGYCYDPAASTRGLSAGLAPENSSLDNFVCGVVTNVPVLAP